MSCVDGSTLKNPNSHLDFAFKYFSASDSTCSEADFS